VAVGVGLAAVASQRHLHALAGPRATAAERSKIDERRKGVSMLTSCRWDYERFVRCRYNELRSVPIVDVMMVAARLSGVGSKRNFGTAGLIT